MTCPGVDASIAILGDRLSAIDKQLVVIEERFEERLFDALWRGMCTRVLSLIQTHLPEIIVAIIGAAIGLIEFLRK